MQHDIVIYVIIDMVVKINFQNQSEVRKMLITICDVPERYEPAITEAGGVVVRQWNGLMDVQFSEHKMYVRDAYVKLRSKNHITLVLYDYEFSRIHIQ